MAEIRIKIVGRSPLLTHNEQLADPTCPIVVEMAKYTAKKSNQKTLEDHAAIARLEWYGGLYIDPAILGPVMPTRNIKRSFRDGAAKQRQGTLLRDALIFTDLNVPIVYDGPRDIDELFKLTSFQSRMGVGMSSGSRVMRTRPQFPAWSIVADAYLDEGILDFAKTCEAIEVAGRRAGLGDGREINYGRFTAEVIRL